MGILETLEQQYEVDIQEDKKEEEQEESKEELEEQEEGNEEEPEDEELEESEEDDEDEEEPKDSKAFIKARKRSQAAEAKAEALARENRELSEKLAHIDGKLEALLGTKAPTEESNPRPEFDELNPQEYIEWQQRDYDAKLKALEEKFREADEERAMSETKNTWDSIDREFREKDAEYAGAMDYLVSQAKEQLRASNPDLSEIQINQYIKQLEYQHVGKAAAAGVSPDMYFKIKAMDAGHNPFKLSAPKKPTIAKAKRNQQRSATAIGKGSGKSGDDLAVSDLKGMNFNQMLSLSDSEWNNMHLE